VVIDALRWADPASLRVLELMAGELRTTQTLVVMTMRQLATDAPPALLDCVSELARQPGAIRLEITGLTEHDVDEWLGVRGAPGVSRVVHARTEGNALFVREVIELLAGGSRAEEAQALAPKK